MNLLKEENGQLIFLVPRCPKDKYVMSGLEYKFYNDPTVASQYQITEGGRATTWYEFMYICPRCLSRVKLSEQEIDLINSYNTDDIKFPPNFNASLKNVTKLGNV